MNKQPKRITILTKSKHSIQSTRIVNPELEYSQDAELFNNGKDYAEFICNCSSPSFVEGLLSKLIEMRVAANGGN